MEALAIALAIEAAGLPASELPLCATGSMCSIGRPATGCRHLHARSHALIVHVGAAAGHPRGLVAVPPGATSCRQYTYSCASTRKVLTLSILTMACAYLYFASYFWYLGTVRCPLHMAMCGRKAFAVGRWMHAAAGTLPLELRLLVGMSHAW